MASAALCEIFTCSAEPGAQKPHGRCRLSSFWSVTMCGCSGTKIARADARMAAMKTVRPRVSYADLQQAPEDGRRYELYEGEAFVVPAPLPRHQRVVLELVRRLDRYAEQSGGEVLVSPIDIVFSEFDVLQPDVVFFQAARRHLVKADEAIRIAPDLVVEVISSSTATTDRGKKMQMYARYGVAEYWIVDPRAREVELYQLTDQGLELMRIVRAPDALQSVALRQLEIPTNELFDD